MEVTSAMARTVRQVTIGLPTSFKMMSGFRFSGESASGILRYSAVQSRFVGTLVKSEMLLHNLFKKLQNLLCSISKFRQSKFSVIKLLLTDSVFSSLRNHS